MDTIAEEKIDYSVNSKFSEQHINENNTTGKFDSKKDKLSKIKRR